MKQFKALFSTSSIHSLATMGDTSDFHSPVVFVSVEVSQVLEMGGVERQRLGKECTWSGFSSFWLSRVLPHFSCFPTVSIASAKCIQVKRHVTLRGIIVSSGSNFSPHTLLRKSLAFLKLVQYDAS